jgi:hypothetical protein
MTNSPHEFRTVQNTALKIDVDAQYEQFANVLHDFPPAHFYLSGLSYVRGYLFCVFDGVVDQVFE